MRNASLGRAGLEKRRLPARVVITIAVNGLKIRLWRSMVTASGIMLGIAFLSFVLTGKLLSTHAGMEQQARQTWLVVMALLISFVSITNSMLMSVAERFREIGTMKCLGAQDRFVVNLFLIEATLVGMVSSVAGWAVGFLAAMIVRWSELGFAGALKGVSGNLVLELCVGCALLGGVLTLLATIMPAIQAAAMPAAAALRTEV